jgi:hypothetical protein
MLDFFFHGIWIVSDFLGNLVKTLFGLRKFSKDTIPHKFHRKTATAPNPSAFLNNTIFMYFE